MSLCQNRKPSNLLQHKTPHNQRGKAHIYESHNVSNRNSPVSSQPHLEMYEMTGQNHVLTFIHTALYPGK